MKKYQIHTEEKDGYSEALCSGYRFTLERSQGDGNWYANSASGMFSDTLATYEEALETVRRWAREFDEARKGSPIW